jgi:hypothetical protein
MLGAISKVLAGSDDLQKIDCVAGGKESGGESIEEWRMTKSKMGSSGVSIPGAFL